MISQQVVYLLGYFFDSGVESLHTCYESFWVCCITLR